MSEKMMSEKTYSNERVITICDDTKNRTIIRDIYDPGEFLYHEYLQAARCIEGIVYQTEQYLEEWKNYEPGFNAGPGYSRYKSTSETGFTWMQELRGYPNNFVAFSGSRGQGKTSAMLSVSSALSRMRNRSSGQTLRSDIIPKNSEEISNFWKTAHERVIHNSNYNAALTPQKYFYVLDPIDPTTIQKGGNILLDILSDMFYAFNEAHLNRLDPPEPEKDQKLLLHFQTVRQSLKNLKQEDQIDPTQDDLSALAEVGDSSRMKKNFTLLVRDFLDYMGCNFLVLQIDDADLDVSRVFEFVEDLRKYCVIPRVIILMAVHLNSLKRCIEQENIRKYEYLLRKNLKTAHMEDYRCREITERYIDKLLPGERQIHLPFLDDLIRNDTVVRLRLLQRNVDNRRGNRDSDKINYIKEKFIGLQDDTDVTGGVRNYQNALLLMVYKKTGIPLMPFEGYLHNLLPRRLRELVHFLNFLRQLDDVIDEETSAARPKTAVESLGDLIDERINLHKSDVPPRLETRLYNLDQLEQYFRKHWCPIILTKAQCDVIEAFFKTPGKTKHLGVIDALDSYFNGLPKHKRNIYKKIRKRNLPKKTADSPSYCHIMCILNDIKNEMAFENKYEFVYAVRFCYTIHLNRLFLTHLKLDDGFKELAECCNGNVFFPASRSEFDKKTTEAITELLIKGSGALGDTYDLSSGTGIDRVKSNVPSLAGRFLILTNFDLQYRIRKVNTNYISDCTLINRKELEVYDVNRSVENKKFNKQFEYTAYFEGMSLALAGKYSASKDRLQPYEVSRQYIPLIPSGNQTWLPLADPLGAAERLSRNTSENKPAESDTASDTAADLPLTPSDSVSPDAVHLKQELRTFADAVFALLDADVSDLPYLAGSAPSDYPAFRRGRELFTAIRERREVPAEALEKFKEEYAEIQDSLSGLIQDKPLTEDQYAELLTALQDEEGLINYLKNH